jgi:CrcB protein
MTAILSVFFGAGLGGVARMLAGKYAMTYFGAGFPYGTLGVNIIGSFLIGVAFILFAGPLEASQNAKLFLITGFLGGFTTFSAFSLDAYALWAKGDLVAAGGYVAASVVLSLAGVVLGLAIAKVVV